MKRTKEKKETEETVNTVNTVNTEKTADSEPEKKQKIRYRVGKRNFFMRLSWLLLAVSVLFLVMANWGFWHELDKTMICFKIVLPAASCIVYMLIINHMGEKGFFLTFIPVLSAAAYMIISVVDSGKMLYSLIGITLCIIVTLAYMMTVFGLIRSKWALLPIIGLPLAYRIAVEDHDLFFAGNAVHLTDLLPELSTLCMLTALFFIVFAMKKRDFTNKEKPIEEVLLELEENPAGEEAADNTQEAEPVQQTEVPETDNEAVIIAPAGEKYE